MRTRVFMNVCACVFLYSCSWRKKEMNVVFVFFLCLKHPDKAYSKGKRRVWMMLPRDL